jgi:hypothetical protein
VTRLASIAAATALLAVGCLADSSSKSSDAGQYRHYFNIGKRACRAGETTTHTAHGVQAQIVFTVLDLRKYPAKYRKAVDAGCRAAG